MSRLQTVARIYREEGAISLGKTSCKYVFNMTVGRAFYYLRVPTKAVSIKLGRLISYDEAITRRFHRIYYGSSGTTHEDTYWLGVPALKCPLDLWIYQEIIFALKPDAIVECGTRFGGSALFMASILDVLGVGEVITVDIEDVKGKPQHRRVRYLIGSSTSEDTVEHISKLVDGKQTVIVLLDSDHHKEHVLKELRIYSRFVTKGSYLIVEDTNINGHPVLQEFGVGPMEAVAQFLKENGDFAVDKSKEKYYLTYNPKGYLLRIR